MKKHNWTFEEYFKHKLYNKNDFERITDVYFDNINLPEIDNVRNLAAECIILGLYLPAILTTNYLLEHSLKVFLTYHDSRKSHDKIRKTFKLNEEMTKSSNKFINKSFRSNLTTALNNKIITKEEYDKLLIFNNDYRNAYYHANRDVMYKGKTAETVLFTLDKDNKPIIMERADSLLSSLLYFDFNTLKNEAYSDCFNYLKELSKIIADIKYRMYDAVKDDSK